MIAVSLEMSDEPDFFYIVHYIVYRWYRIHGEDHLMSLLYAGGLQMLLSFILIVNIDYFVCLFFSLTSFSLTIMRVTLIHKSTIAPFFGK